MPKDNSETPQIRNVFEILSSIEGNSIPIDKKEELAIEVAEHLLKDSKKNLFRHEKHLQKAIAKMVKKPLEKWVFITAIDQCFRAIKTTRSAEQITYLINQFNIPCFFSYSAKLTLLFFKYFSPKVTRFIVPSLTRKLRKEISNIIIPIKDNLSDYLKKRNEDGVKVNITHIHEDTLSEADAKKNLQLYLDDLKEDDISCISIKISSIYSQINPLAFEDTIDTLAKRLRKLYRHAMDHTIKQLDNSEKPKFVNLDLEEHNDLALTVTLFIKVLSEPEFHNLSAGITLQAYFPESFKVQEQITKWAKDRVANSGAPIKIRIVKGTNLALEQLRSSLGNLEQPTYTSKTKVNANFMKMLMYAMVPENTRAVHLEIATHNLFDIGFALLNMNEYQVKQYVSFEMMEGMANHIMRSIQKITSNISVYCPVAGKNDLPYSIAYLIRCLDDSTGHDNFLKHISILKSGSEEWESQSCSFSESIKYIPKLKNTPRRAQDRSAEPTVQDFNTPFENEPETDFSLEQNIEFAKNTLLKFQDFKPELIPCIINEKTISENEDGIGYNPSESADPYYRYTLATQNHVNECLDSARSFFSSWKETKLNERLEIFQNLSKLIRKKRAELLGIMMNDTSKVITEADAEINKAIDYVEYYSRIYIQISNTKGTSVEPKGVTLVASSWDSPYSEPIGEIISALISGNSVIFKPAPDAVLTGWHLVNIFWDSGISKGTLQFLNLNPDNENYLINDTRLNKIVLTGTNSRTKSLLEKTCSLDLSAETYGKNLMIITNMCDVDFAIKDLITSAFSGSGQKRSSVSLAIIEKDLYDNEFFIEKLKDAAQSLKVGPSTSLMTYVGPLINKPDENLTKALTTLEKKESWLLKPMQNAENPNLWSPGIKIGTEVNSFMHLEKFSGPILALIRAKNLTDAIEIANSTEDGLISVLQSLDAREQLIWRKNIKYSNCYINRSTKDIIAQRQPFGDFHSCTFGPGYKIGGPNYLYNFVNIHQSDLPKEKHPINSAVNELSSFIEKIDLSAEELGIWYASISNYAYWWKRMKTDRDSSKLVGQDNYLKYVPLDRIVFRVTSTQNELNLMRILAAALTCECKLEISFDKENTQLKHINLLELSSIFQITNEKEKSLIDRIKSEQVFRLRIQEKPSNLMCKAAALAKCYVADQPVVSNGNVELLHYTKEICTSINYHRRYGNLGIRSSELRKQIT